MCISSIRFLLTKSKVGFKRSTRLSQNFSLVHVGTMPPKTRTRTRSRSSESEGPGPLLGRFGTSLKCGIVGLPNVG